MMHKVSSFLLSSLFRGKPTDLEVTKLGVSTITPQQFGRAPEVIHLEELFKMEIHGIGVALFVQ